MLKSFKGHIAQNPILHWISVWCQGYCQLPTPSFSFDSPPHLLILLSWCKSFRLWCPSSFGSGKTALPVFVQHFSLGTGDQTYTEKSSPRVWNSLLLMVSKAMLCSPSLFWVCLQPPSVTAQKLWLTSSGKVHHALWGTLYLSFLYVSVRGSTYTHEGDQTQEGRTGDTFHSEKSPNQEDSVSALNAVGTHSAPLANSL